MTKKYLNLGLPFLLSFIVGLLLLAMLNPENTSALSCDVPSDSFKTIQAAIDDSSCETILLVSESPYIENLVINRQITILGQGVNKTKVNGNASGSTLKVQLDGDAFLSDMTIFNGSEDHGGGINNRGFLVISGTHLISNTAMGLDGFGGGIFNDMGTLIITNSTIISNSASSGGGVFNTGSLTVVNTLFEANLATTGSSQQGGGGIYNECTGTGFITQSTFEKNMAPNGYGGGILNAQNNEACESSVTLTTTHSLIANNYASLGGGIANMNIMLLDNSTVSNNTVPSGSFSGGIYNGLLTKLLNSTIVYNENGGIGVGSLIQINNSIVSNNTPRNCLFTQAIFTSRYNVFDDTSCCGSNGCSLQTTISDPLIDSLKDNGGKTLTHALLPFSPAIESGDPLNCPETDQRGVNRPVDVDNNEVPICDIGSYEYEGSAHVLKISDVNVDEGDEGLSEALFNVSLWYSHTEQIKVSYKTVSDTAEPITDFVPTSGVLSFAPGEMEKTIPISILGDVNPEGRESFLVQLSNPINATIFDGEGVGTIYERDYRQYLPIISKPIFIVADFDNCLGTNNLGGMMGAAYNPPDSLIESYVPVPERGCVARLQFNIIHWSAFWMKLEKANLTPFSKLNFDVRANSPVPNRIKVELKRYCNDGICEEMSIIYVAGLSTEWQTISVDLDDFGSTGYPGIFPISSWQNIEELVFTFEAEKSGSSGVVYLDNITFGN